MAEALGVLMLLGPIALIAALVAMVHFYHSYRGAPEPKRRLSVAVYVFVGLGFGFMAYIIGTIVGISAACNWASTGNLCGLVGIFGIGPLVSAMAIYGFAHSSSRRAKQAP
jgi:hypothetical protein